MKYAIDTSALIGAWHEMFPRDLFETLWTRLEAMCADHELSSPDVVVDELSVQEGDALYQWVNSYDCFKYPLDENLQATLTTVMSTCCKDPATSLVNINKKKSDADPIVIAHALVHGLSVISQENPRNQPNERLKLPDACVLMNVEHLSLFEFLRREGFRFDLVGNT